MLHGSGPANTLAECAHEVGQLLFIGAMLSSIALLRRLPVRTPAWAWRLPPYAIGSVAAFWVIQRLTLFAG